MRLLLLVRAYRFNGHTKATLDPLGLEEREVPDYIYPALYGFFEGDLRWVIHIGDPEKCNWLRDKLENTTPLR
ncbi:hypothetical protein MLD38_003687 [Melastoma candidum]|uniref:Uncharacterized protein n=1 Tax=Melastoma candidum TaxID=119954 RepID=A0ACB9S393_9MYRT|nr:hypothetical protein MLD38_003687 [Melastoma candidum]